MDRGLRRRLPKLACIPSGGRGREWAVDRWCAARGVTRGKCALLVGLAVRSAMPGGVGDGDARLRRRGCLAVPGGVFIGLVGFGV